MREPRQVMPRGRVNSQALLLPNAEDVDSFPSPPAEAVRGHNSPSPWPLSWPLDLFCLVSPYKMITCNMLNILLNNCDIIRGQCSLSWLPPWSFGPFALCLWIKNADNLLFMCNWNSVDTVCKGPQHPPSTFYAPVNNVLYTIEIIWDNRSIVPDVLI